MLGSWSRSCVLVWENHEADIRLIARSLIRGIKWVQRLVRLVRASTCSIKLDEYLVKLTPPRKVLLVAHGDNGRFWIKPSPSGPSQILPEDWWGNLDDQLNVYALGCSSSECFVEYQLADRVNFYLGYKDDISFFVGTRRGRGIVRNILGRIGSRFISAPSLSEEFMLKMKEEYVTVMDTIGAKYSARDGDRLSLIFLEEQLQNLELQGGGS